MEDYFYYLVKVGSLDTFEVGAGAAAMVTVAAEKKYLFLFTATATIALPPAQKSTICKRDLLHRLFHRRKLTATSSSTSRPTSEAMALFTISISLTLSGERDTSCTFSTSGSPPCSTATRRIRIAPTL